MTLKSVFRMALDDEAIETTPCAGKFELPTVQRETRCIPMPVEEVARLANAMPERYRAMVITRAWLGLRVGELLTLQRRYVDFMRRVVHVERRQSDKGANFTEKTKNEKIREVLLPRQVAEALAAHLAQDPQDDPNGFLFRSRFGNAVRADYYTVKVLARAVQEAGLRGRTSHDLRHHFVSVLLHGGTSFPTTAAMIRDTEAVTLKRPTRT